MQAGPNDLMIAFKDYMAWEITRELYSSLIMKIILGIMYVLNIFSMFSGYLCTTGSPNLYSGSTPLFSDLM